MQQFSRPKPELPCPVLHGRSPSPDRAVPLRRAALRRRASLGGHPRRPAVRPGNARPRLGARGRRAAGQGTAGLGATGCDPRRTTATGSQPGHRRGPVRQAAAFERLRATGRTHPRRTGPEWKDHQLHAATTGRHPAHLPAEGRGRGDVRPGALRRPVARAGAAPGAQGRAVAVHRLRDDSLTAGRTAGKPGLRDDSLAAGRTAGKPGERRKGPHDVRALPISRQAWTFLGSPWQRLYFLPEPQGQGALRSTLP